MSEGKIKLQRNRLVGQHKVRTAMSNKCWRPPKMDTSDISVKQLVEHYL